MSRSENAVSCATLFTRLSPKNNVLMTNYLLALSISWQRWNLEENVRGLRTATI